MKKLGMVLLVAHALGYADIVINDYMDTETRDKTGISKLNKNQVILLEAWLNKNFMPKTTPTSTQEVFLSENLSNGALLRLSDGSIFEVNPQDISLSSLWITPIPLNITTADDPNYPFMLTNKNTGTSVHARKPQISPSLPNPLPPATKMPVPSSNMPSR